jgi:crotonobetainyl-CoA:carnitine CoA-transferase CaiB-like acyl-CoA transferase
MPTSHLPPLTSHLFEGLRVVEFASVLAGPAVGMFFAELGAEVVKIENKTTGGDVTRHWKLPEESPESPVSAYYASVNWGKRSLRLDLGLAADREEAIRLASEADVVISNFKPSAADRFGLGADQLLRLNPRLIYAQVYAFDDPADERPAFDVVMQAEAGFLFMNGEPGGPPVKMPVALIDLLAAHQLKEAVLIALLHRERTGQGSVVSTSLLESALASLANQATNWLMAGNVPQRLGTRHPNIAPYGDIFYGADTQPILLAVGTERQFAQLCRCTGLEELLDQADFQTNSARVRHREALNARLAEALVTRPAADWLELFQSEGVPAARIRDMPTVFELPAAQRMILESDLEGQPARTMRTVAFQVRPFTGS